MRKLVLLALISGLSLLTPKASYSASCGLVVTLTSPIYLLKNIVWLGSGDSSWNNYRLWSKNAYGGGAYALERDWTSTGTPTYNSSDGSFWISYGVTGRSSGETWRYKADDKGFKSGFGTWECSVAELSTPTITW